MTPQFNDPYVTSFFSLSEHLKPHIISKIEMANIPRNTSWAVLSHASIHEDEEDHAFSSDVYSLAACNEEELHNQWRVFTNVAKTSGSVSDELQGRRLENAAWRLQGMRQQGRSPSGSALNMTTMDVPILEEMALTTKP